MDKKTLNRKVARQFILDHRNAGETDQEIYYKLSEQYYDKKTIANLLRSIPTKENKSKYKIQNTVLLIFIGLTIVSKIFAVLDLVITRQEPFLLLYVFIAPLLNIWLFYEIVRYNASIYMIAGCFCIIGFFNSLNNTIDTELIYLLLNVFVCGVILGLSCYLSNKLFLKLKKDMSGEYIFEEPKLSL